MWRGWGFCPRHSTYSFLCLGICIMTSVQWACLVLLLPDYVHVLVSQIPIRCILIELTQLLSNYWVLIVLLHLWHIGDRYSSLANSIRQRLSQLLDSYWSFVTVFMVSCLLLYAEKCGFTTIMHAVIASVLLSRAGLHLETAMGKVGQKWAVNKSGVWSPKNEG